MKSFPFSVAQNLALGLMGTNAGAATQRPFDAYSMMKDGTLYIRTSAASNVTSGLVELLDSSIRTVVGITSFNGTQLKAGQRLVLEQVRFAVAEVANSVALTAAAMQTYSTKYTDCPLPLRHAELIITQAAAVKFSMPIERLLNNGTIEKAVGKDGYYLESPCVLEPEVETRISIRFPDAAAAVAYTANKIQFVEILLMGPELFKN